MLRDRPRWTVRTMLQLALIVAASISLFQMRARQLNAGAKAASHRSKSRSLVVYAAELSDAVASNRSMMDQLSGPGSTPEQAGEEADEGLRSARAGLGRARTPRVDRAIQEFSSRGRQIAEDRGPAGSRSAQRDLLAADRRAIEEMLTEVRGAIDRSDALARRYERVARRPWEAMPAESGPGRR